MKRSLTSQERHGRMEHLILQFSMKAHLESMHSMFYGRMLRIHRDMLKQGERLYPAAGLEPLEHFFDSKRSLSINIKGCF